MPDEGLLDELLVDKEESLEKILVALLDDENIEMKTEIQKPLNLTRLKVLSVWLKNHDMTKSAQMIDSFIAYYLVYMVSKGRMSRKEIISALTDGLKEERGFKQKLFAPKTKG